MQNENPLVTIVIPSFNHSLYIESAIYSVLNQSYELVELIVIDDGSTDDSVKKINDIRSRHDFFFLCRENFGQVATLNHGIELATGDYIAFLASDDCFYPDHVENAVRELLNSDRSVAAVYCDGFIINNSSSITHRFSQLFPKPIVGSLRDNILIGNWLPALGVTYRRDVLLQCPFDDRYLTEDYAMYLTLILRCGLQIKSYKGFGFFYRMHDSNVSLDYMRMSESYYALACAFPELKNFVDFKVGIRSFNTTLHKVSDLRLFYLLWLQLVRAVQKKLFVLNCSSIFKFEQGG